MSSWFRLPALAAGILVVTITSAAVGSGFELLSKREYQSELDKRAAAPQAPQQPIRHRVAAPQAPQ